MIVVITTPQLGKLLQGSEELSGRQNKKLQQWLQTHHASLRPTFPGVEDETMVVYFQLVSQQHISDVDIEELRELPGIDGAYRKAAEEPPA